MQLNFIRLLAMTIKAEVQSIKLPKTSRSLLYMLDQIPFIIHLIWEGGKRRTWGDACTRQVWGEGFEGFGKVWLAGGMEGELGKVGWNVGERGYFGKEWKIGLRWIESEGWLNDWQRGGEDVH